MAQDDETYQIKELLSGGFKFPDSPQNNKLTQLKDVHKWLLKIRHTFRRYANFYMFLYATAGYIDTTMELKPRRLQKDKVKKELVKKERHRAKVLSGSEETESSPEEEDEDEEKHAGLPKALQQELSDFGGISTYEELGKFMKVSTHAKRILSNPVLGMVAPFMASTEAKPAGNDPLSKFNSLGNRNS